MIVRRSAFRPAAPAPTITQFRADLREALAGAKRRQKPVTLPVLRALAKNSVSGERS